MTMERVFRRAAAVLAAACMAGAMLPVTALADYMPQYAVIDVRPYGWDSDTMEPGRIYSEAEPWTDSYGVWVDDWTVSRWDAAPGRAYTYDITLRTDSYSGFPQDFSVRVLGACEASVRSVSGRTARVTAKAYPVYMLEDPGHVTVTPQETGRWLAEWDEVPYASKYEIEVEYKTRSGYLRYMRKTSSVPRLSISGAYDDVHVSVRAMAPEGSAGKFMRDSLPQGDSGYLDYDVWDTDTSFPDLPYADARYGSTVWQQPAGQGHWEGYGDTWRYFYPDGRQAFGWVEDGPGNWYYVRQDGLMAAGGWNWIDNDWYYLNNEHDGTYGRMYSGYIRVGGKDFYLNQAHDGRFGAMYANRYAPDGRWAAADGTLY